jgi:hypothetical protein
LTRSTRSTTERDRRIRRDLKTIKKLEDNLRTQKIDNYKKSGWTFGSQKVGKHKKYTGLYRQKRVGNDNEHVNVYVANNWQDLDYKIRNEAQAKGWSTGYAGEDLTKKQLEILHYIADHTKTHSFKDRLQHIDKYRKRLGLKFSSKKLNVYHINGKLSIPQRKIILHKLQEMARIQGEGDDSEDNLI